MNFQAAEQFIWESARLLERRLFDFYFVDGDPERVEAVIFAYRNADGGFGHALEPDCRSPHSQPEAMRLALQVLDDVHRLSTTTARECADWLDSIAHDSGALPFCLPTIEGYPKAPWWTYTGNADINPTGRLVGLLRSYVPDHPWV